MSEASAADGKGQSRIDFYLGHLAYCQAYLPPQIRHVVADAFYSKRKWVDGVTQLNLHVVGKLRCDANLKFFYNGPQKPRGRKRVYGQKVDLSTTEGLQWVETLSNGIQVYSAQVWSVALKRRIVLVYLLKEEDGKFSHAVLFSTDLSLTPQQIYRFYKARFQIEFLFRDARQFTGLADCQARNLNALDAHFNASLTALNLAKATITQQNNNTQPVSFSLASCKRLALNEHLLELFISLFDLDQTLIKSHPNYQALLSYGTIAA